MTEDLTLEDVRRMARDAGLARLTESHLHELLRATRTARMRRTALPTADLTPSDEPAHTFRVER